jgi:hypothetical protein
LTGRLLADVRELPAQRRVVADRTAQQFNDAAELGERWATVSVWGINSRCA